MIIEAIFTLVKYLLLGILILLPDIPSLPNNILTALDNGLDLIFSHGLNLLPLFINIDTIVTLAPLALIIWNVDKILSIFLWVYRKIPISSD